jgi:hypothetical protein
MVQQTQWQGQIHYLDSASVRTQQSVCSGGTAYTSIHDSRTAARKHDSTQFVAVGPHTIVFRAAEPQLQSIQALLGQSSKHACALPNKCFRPPFGRGPFLLKLFLQPLVQVLLSSLCSKFFLIGSERTASV